MRIARRFFNAVLMAALAIPVGGLAACGTPKPPPPREYALTTPYTGLRTLAVAPAVNQSGSDYVDTLGAADKVFEELQQVHGLNVLPVNKTLTAMQKLGMARIDSPAAAQRLAEAMGADGIVITAITAYDPYKPPTVGMVMQLYTPRPLENTPLVQARTLSGSELPAGEPAETMRSDQQPVAHVAAVFNASNQTVLAELQDFAQGRSNYESALQESRYLADSDAYMRFVSHAMVRRLLEVERIRLAGR